MRNVFESLNLRKDGERQMAEYAERHAKDECETCRKQRKDAKYSPAQIRDELACWAKSAEINRQRYAEFSYALSILELDAK